MFVSRSRFLGLGLAQRARCSHSRSRPLPQCEIQQLSKDFRGKIKQWVGTLPEEFEQEQHQVSREKGGLKDEFETSQPRMFLESAGKINPIPPAILAPKDVIYQRLSESGLVSSRLKKPLACRKLIKRSHADIVAWYNLLGRGLLEYYRVCTNLSSVKAIVEYHIRWSAIRTLAAKYGCNERAIVGKFGRDLECVDERGTKIALMPREEIKRLKRTVNVKVQITDQFRALKILDSMKD